MDSDNISAPCFSLAGLVLLSAVLNRHQASRSRSSCIRTPLATCSSATNEQQNAAYNCADKPTEKDAVEKHHKEVVAHEGANDSEKQAPTNAPLSTVDKTANDSSQCASDAATSCADSLFDEAFH